MSQHRGLALALPTYEQLGDWAKTLAAIGGLVAGLWAACRRLWRVWQARRRLRALERKAIRYLLDAQRHTLYAVIPTPDRVVVIEKLKNSKDLIDQVRDDLWVADGHESALDEERRVENIVRVITRTQRIQLKAEAERRGE